MKEEARNFTDIHISEIDEFLAGRLLDGDDLVIGFTVSRKDLDGTITIGEYSASPEPVPEEGIDFELSPSEYLDPGDTRIDEYLKCFVYTSSAYELFDLVLMYYDSFDCIAEFTGNAWKIRIINPVSMNG